MFLTHVEAPKADLRDIQRVHAPYYVESIFENVPTSGQYNIDPDTGLAPGSGEAALRAVGSACAAVDAVVGGEARNAFCVVRPPGHHAEPSPGPWGSACSTTRPSRPSTPMWCVACRESRSSISTSITATARRRRWSAHAHLFLRFEPPVARLSGHRHGTRDGHRQQTWSNAILAPGSGSETVPRGPTPDASCPRCAPSNRT